MPFLGYMEVAAVVASAAPGFAPGDIVAATFGHKTGHTANPAHELLVPLPPDLDPILGIFVAQMGPICANGILHADAEALGAAGAAARRRHRRPPGRRLGRRHRRPAHRALRPPRRRRGHRRRALRLAPRHRRPPRLRGACPRTTPGRRPSAAGTAPRAAAPTSSSRPAPAPRASHRALRALRPQGTVIDLAFYQGGLDGTRLGEEFHHNGLAIRCAQIGRVPRGFAPLWDRRRLAAETVGAARAPRATRSAAT